MSEPHASPSPPTLELPPAADPLGRVRAQLRPGTRVRTTGLQGAARGHLLARLSRQLRAPLVCITADEDSAEQLAADLAFFLGGVGLPRSSPNVLQLPGDEVLPWDELTPDPAAVVAERLGTLFHLRQGTRFPALVLSWRALHKRVLPPDVLELLSEMVGVGQDARPRRVGPPAGADGLPVVAAGRGPGDVLCRAAASSTSSRRSTAGRSGSSCSATRWSRCACSTRRPSAPSSSSRRLTLVPAREVLFTEKTKSAAEAAARAAAERINIPTSQLRETLEQIREGIPAYGHGGAASGLLRGRARHGARLPAPLVARAADLRGRSGRGDARRRGAPQRDRPGLGRGHRAQGLALPPEAHFASDDALLAGLCAVPGDRGRRAVALGLRRAPVAFTFGDDRGPARGHPLATTARRAR